MNIALYIATLIEEKGRSVDDTIDLDGHFGLTYQMLIDFIHVHSSYHKHIKDTLVMIDFKNGDVFHYLDYLAAGMVNSVSCI